MIILHVSTIIGEFIFEINDFDEILLGSVKRVINSSEAMLLEVLPNQVHTLVNLYHSGKCEVLPVSAELFKEYENSHSI